MTEGQLLRLLQLASPTLPVGAYSYSEGLEFLVHAGKMRDGKDLEHWLVQELRYGAVRLEAAVMVRGYRALLAEDFDQLQAWNDWLSAARETEELRSQSWQMGRSLMRLFQDLKFENLKLQDPKVQELRPPEDMKQPDNSASLPYLAWNGGCNFAIAYGIVAANWKIDVRSAVVSYLHSWATNLISAAIKLIPLGQTVGQQLLLNLNLSIDEAGQEIIDLPDDELFSCGWGLALASMSHENQYSRLFRS